jgi:hypothetical protein
VGGRGRGNILCSSTFRYVVVLSGALAYRSGCMQLAQCLSWSSSPGARSVRDTDAIWKSTCNSYWGFMRKENAYSTWLTAGVTFAVVKSISRLTGSNNKRRKESKEKGNKTHVLMEKLLTPIARTFPVSRSFSISAQASLKLTLSVVL